MDLHRNPELKALTCFASEFLPQGHGGFGPAPNNLEDIIEGSKPSLDSESIETRRASSLLEASPRDKSDEEVENILDEDEAGPYQSMKAGSAHSRKDYSEDIPLSSPRVCEESQSNTQPVDLGPGSGLYPTLVSAGVWVITALPPISAALISLGFSSILWIIFVVVISVALFSVSIFLLAEPRLSEKLLAIFA